MKSNVVFVTRKMHRDLSLWIRYWWMISWIFFSFFIFMFFETEIETDREFCPPLEILFDKIGKTNGKFMPGVYISTWKKVQQEIK